MCLHPRPVEPVPEETARVAKAAFPNGNRYLCMRDELGTIFEDEQFGRLFLTRGKPAFSPWRLALVTVMQFAEGLSDRQAADAVRGRLDWKYALSLELTDAGFDASILCEFRARLLAGPAESLLFDALLERFRELGLLKARGRQRTDSTHVLAAARGLNRLELVGETMRLALNALAVSAPGWLRGHMGSGWADRYARPFDDLRLPRGKEARRGLAERIGGDGHALLDAVGGEGAPAWLREIPAVDTLCRVWVQQYLRTAEPPRLRTDKDGLPPASGAVESPVDPEARPSKKRGTSWLGYKVHLTETCDEGAPGLLTGVETTAAPVPDTRATPAVHRALEGRGLLPATHVVDSGYVDARWILEARERHGVDLLGSPRSNYGWQAREETGFDLASFEIDWERKVATCPEGQESSSWRRRVRRGQRILGITFSRSTCGVCPSRDLCIRTTGSARVHGRPRRELTVTSEEHYEALRLAREREATPGYAEEYAFRNGIEGTISRAVRSLGLRRSRYVGLRKTRLQHSLTAAALNFVRAGEWFSGTPRPAGRSSPFSEPMRPAGVAWPPRRTAIGRARLSVSSPLRKTRCRLPVPRSPSRPSA